MIKLRYGAFRHAARGDLIWIASLPDGSSQRQLEKRLGRSVVSKNNYLAKKSKEIDTK